MRIHDRQKLVNAGLIKKELKAASKEAKVATVAAATVEAIVTPKEVMSFDELADTIHAAIISVPDGYEQGQLMRDLKEQGWEFDDVSIALAILHRRKQIVLVGE